MDEPGYYAIIIAEVRYDPALSPSAKLLYAELTALCNKEGYCWAGNGYFARLYGMSDRNVRRLLAELEGAGHIEIEVREGFKRSVRLSRNVRPSPDKKFHPPGQERPHNSTSNNKETFTLRGDEPGTSGFAKQKRRPENEAEVVDYCVSIGLTSNDGVYYWSKWAGNGFRNAGRAILDWKAVIRSAKAGGFAPSQKRGGNYGNNTKREGARADQHHDRRRHVEDPAEGGGGGLPSI